MITHPLDLPAMAAWGAFYGIDSGSVAEDWPRITARTRENWRAAVDAAIMAAGLSSTDEVSRLRSIISEMTTAIRSQMDGKTEIRRAEVDDWEGRAGTGPGTDKEDSE